MNTFMQTWSAGRYRTVRSTLRGFAAATGVLAIAAFLAIGPSISDASASAATPFGQCNGVDNTPGLGLTCAVTVTNTFNAATGVGSSVTVLKECHGAANTAPSSCVSSTRSGNTVISSVSQCNSAINGGGGTVICNVRVVNNITGASTLSGATVNECIGSAGGGGTEPTLSCNPGGNSSGATVTQCNGSANGGGGTMRVRCTVLGSTSASALRVTISQCNGSANGGGSTVTCSAQVTNTVKSASTNGGASGAAGGGASTTPVAAPVAPPTAAETAQALADRKSAATVNESLRNVGGANPVSALTTPDTAGNAVLQAIRDAAAAINAQKLAYTGIEAALYVLVSIIALIIGTVLFLVGRRANTAARLAE